MSNCIIHKLQSSTIFTNNNNNNNNILKNENKNKKKEIKRINKNITTTNNDKNDAMQAGVQLGQAGLSSARIKDSRFWCFFIQRDHHKIHRSLQFTIQHWKRLFEESTKSFFLVFFHLLLVPHCWYEGVIVLNALKDCNNTNNN